MRSFRSGSQGYESPDSRGSWDWSPLALCFGTAISKLSVRKRETKKKTQTHPKTANLSKALQKPTSFRSKNSTCPAERERPYCTDSQLFILKDRCTIKDRFGHLLASKGSPVYLSTYSIFLHLPLSTWENNLQ